MLTASGHSDESDLRATTPVRILIVSDVSPLTIRGGGERVLWEQASRLVQRGHDVRMVCRAPDGTTPVEKSMRGVRIRHFQVDRRSALRFFASSVRQARQAVREEIASHEPDVIHVHQPLSGYGALRTSAARHLPSLYTFHSPAPLEYASRRGMTELHRGGMTGAAATAMLWWLERACLREATRLHVLSHFSTDLLWRLYRIPRDRTVFIPGAADLDRFSPPHNREAVRHSLGLPEAAPLFLTIRNLEARMGLDTLIRAFAQVYATHRRAQLLIGGAGSLRVELESLVESLGIGTAVRFLGYIPDEDLPRYYQAADAFVLPTRELEGFGLVTVEALACGTPVLGTPVGGTPEILLPLNPDLLFPGNRPDDLADTLARYLSRYLDQPHFRHSLRERCRHHAEALYSWDRHLGALETTYAALRQPPAHPHGSPPVCPVCGSPIARPLVVYNGQPYLRCTNCGVGRIALTPDRTQSQRHYEREYPARFAITESSPHRQRVFESLLEALGQPPPHAVLLDVGCGEGHLASHARQRGWRGIGTDISHHACATTRRAGIAAFQGEADNLPIAAARVDAMILANVLDHTLDPIMVLREAHRVLRPHGRLIIRIPNATFHRPAIRILSSLGPLPRLRGWDRYPVLHLLSFSARNLTALLVESGFRVSWIRNSPMAAGGLVGPSDTLPPLFRLVAFASRVVSLLSFGSCLIGPSIEICAERPALLPGEQLL